MEELTQEIVDENFARIKAEWDKKVKESGMREGMFVVMDKTGFATHFLYNYQLAKEHVESQGLVMPELVQGLKVSYS